MEKSLFIPIFATENEEVMAKILSIIPSPQPISFSLIVCLGILMVFTSCGGDDGINDKEKEKEKENETAETISDDYEYKLPVVFHVLYKDKNDQKQYPSEARLKLVLDSVNALYKRNHMNITFIMAEQDEDGKELSEKGIMRHEIDSTSMNPMNFIRESSKYGEYTQNIHKFINIYLFHYDKENEQSMGMSVLPVMPSNHTMEGVPDTTATFLNNHTKYANPWGVTINSQYIQESQKWGNINPMCAWNTLAHELGHYLGLLHTFSEDKCEEDDYCSDTKNCDYEAYIDEVELFFKDIKEDATVSFWDLPRRTDCQTSEKYFAHNVMDYMYTIADSLTTQQRKRTRQVLNYCPSVPGLKIKEPTTRGYGETPSAPVLMRPRLSGCPPVRRSAKSPL